MASRDIIDWSLPNPGLALESPGFRPRGNRGRISGSMVSNGGLSARRKPSKFLVSDMVPVRADIAGTALMRFSTARWLSASNSSLFPLVTI